MVQSKYNNSEVRKCITLFMWSGKMGIFQCEMASRTGEPGWLAKQESQGNIMSMHAQSTYTWSTHRNTYCKQWSQVIWDGVLEKRRGLTYTDAPNPYSHRTDHRESGQLPELHRFDHQSLARLMALSDHWPHHIIWWVGSAWDYSRSTMLTWIWFWPGIQ